MALKAIQSDTCYEARENHHVTCDPRKSIPGTAKVVKTHNLYLAYVKGFLEPLIRSTTVFVKANLELFRKLLFDQIRQAGYGRRICL